MKTTLMTPKQYLKAFEEAHEKWNFVAEELTIAQRMIRRGQLIDRFNQWKEKHTAAKARMEKKIVALPEKLLPEVEAEEVVPLCPTGWKTVDC
jgi:hypothetical protein